MPTSALINIQLEAHGFMKVFGTPPIGGENRLVGKGETTKTEQPLHSVYFNKQYSILKMYVYNNLTKVRHISPCLLVRS